MSARGGKKKGSKKTPAWHCNWCHTSKASWQAPGPDGPKTLYAKASDKIKARLVHVEKELVRLTSVPVFDVDAGTETRAPPPKRALRRRRGAHVQPRGAQGRDGRDRR